MSVLLLAGSPTDRSRSSALLDEVQERLRLKLSKRQLAIHRLRIRDLSPQALLLADWGHSSVSRAIEQVAEAHALVIATPVYKAAYSGVLKVFLDLLPQSALKGKVVLPIATGGSPHHMLALDYALRPVLQSLGAKYIMPGVYATDSQIPKDEFGGYSIDDETALRIDEAVKILIQEVLRHAPISSPIIPFDSVQYSV
jgi:FMN reductase